jgi:hypothetical protein
MWTRWFIAVALSVAITAVAVASGGSEERNLPNSNSARTVEAPSLPTVNGKYRMLLSKIYVPQDKASYGLFSDYGMCECPSWAGYNNLPTGYWVYVHPHWYIWRDCVKPNATLPPGALPPRVQGKLGGLQPGVELPLTK